MKNSMRRNQRLNMLVLLGEKWTKSLLNEILQTDALGNDHMAFESGITHHLDRFIKEAVSTHTAYHSLLPKHEVGEIQRCRLLEDAHDRQRSPCSCQSACQQPGGLLAHALHDDVETLPFRHFLSSYQ